MNGSSRFLHNILTSVFLICLGLNAFAQVVPATDPPVAGAVPCLQESLRDIHPRLLFGPEEIAGMRSFYESEKGKPFKDSLLNLLPSLEVPEGDPLFLTNATDGQRQGLWRLPTVALHYVLTGDQESLDRTVEYMRFLMSLPHWETGRELDSGMSVGNVMIGAGLAFDWTYNDLDPQFREAFRDKLIYHARAMYHGGHLKKNITTHYWQGDPANNHRWHRNAGMVLCALAAANGSPEQDWILSQLIPEMDFITKWLPDDGTCHEGPGYLVFGNTHLVLGVQAMDRCLGTAYLELPYFANVADFFVHMLQPGMVNFFPIGDASGAISNYAPFLYKGISVNRQKDLQAAVETARSVNPDSFQMFSWLPLVWYDGSIEGGSLKNLPMTAYFEDIGTATMRDGWGKDNIGALFKCGPFGGYSLNEYRNQTSPPRGINVAHDDPDANSFILSMGGALMTETSRYSKHKQSANHNTILINGTGQITPGEPEGKVWSQPGSADNSKMAVVTGWKESGKIFVIEGEAANSYPQLEGDISRPALERFRRIFIWIEGEYVLVLDDIRAPEPVNIDWLIQGPELVEQDEANGQYKLKRDDINCPFQVVSTKQYTSSIAESSADNRGKALGWEQLRLRTRSENVRLASVYDLWNKDGLLVSIKKNNKDDMTVEVKGPGISDKWLLRDGDGFDGASTVRLKRDGKSRTVLSP